MVPKKSTTPVAKKVDDAPAKRGTGAGRYTGATSGLGVQAFQTKTLEDNFKNKLTDEQIAELWRKEFPKAVKFSDKTVRGVRTRFNKGIHGGQDGTAPKRVSRSFDEDGNELPLRGEKSEAKAAKVKKA
jgi:hypothetical protein